MFGAPASASNASNSLFGSLGTATTGQQSLQTVSNAQPFSIGSSGGIFSNPPTNSASSNLGWNAGATTTQTPLQTATQFGQSGLFGTKTDQNTTENKQQSSTGAKTFLPGRPSLHDILSVAPQWKTTFETICEQITTRDKQSRQLRDTLSLLRSKSEAQKALLAEKVEIARADVLAQNCLLAEIEAQQPAVRKWRRQVNALSTACQRTLGSETSTPQPLIVPQSDYLRFIDDLQKRFQRIEQRAQALEQATTTLRQELQGDTPPVDASLKEVLSLIMSEYKLLKYNQLGLHEELKSAIERFKYAHPRHADLDQQLEDCLKADGTVHLPLLSSSVAALQRPTGKTGTTAPSSSRLLPIFATQ